MQTEQDTDLVRVVIGDHRAFEAVFTALEARAGTAEDRKDLVDHLIAELVRHTVAEEQFMYPAARSHVPDGDAMVDRAIASHTATEVLMKELEGMDPGDERFEPLVDRLVEAVRLHLDEQEAHLLPLLKVACDEEELQHLGFKVLAAKEFAPTRPHPHAPHRPPANLVIGPGVGYIDKIRDALADRDV